MLHNLKIGRYNITLEKTISQQNNNKRSKQ